MKHLYFSPEMSLIGVSAEDVIRTSRVSALNEDASFNQLDKISVNGLKGNPTSNP